MSLRDPATRTDAEQLGLATVAVVWSTLTAIGRGAAMVDLSRVAIPAAVVGVGAVVGAVRRRDGGWWLVAMSLLACGSGVWAETSWRPVVSAVGEERLTLVSDPRLDWPVATAEVRDDHGRRLRLGAAAGAAIRLAELGAGDRIVARIAVTPVEDSPWVRSRHLVGRAGLVELHHVEGPVWWRRPIEWLRSIVTAPSADLDRGPLFRGLVVGDDRDQSVVQRSRFRIAGMSHLLAVSGQNVAFVMAAAAPMVAVVGRRARLVLVAVVLLAFAIATRLEASVLRATATAAVAFWAASTGRRSTGVTATCAAVSGLLVVDPMLRHSIGFVLSVAATAGILLLTPVVRARMRGPAALRTAAAVTIGAQLAVAPFLSAVFGPVRLVSLPANLAAGPAAGFVMMWGYSVGVVRTLLPLPRSVDAVLVAPVRVALWWLDTVAAVAARAAAGWPGGLDVTLLPLALVPAAALAVVAPGRRRLAGGLGALVGVVAVSLVPGAPPRPSGAGWLRLDDGASTVLVLDRPDREELVEALLDDGVGDLRVIVAVSGDRADRDAVADVRALMPVAVVLAPPTHRIPGARAVHGEVVLCEGPARRVRLVSGRLEVGGLGPSACT